MSFNFQFFEFIPRKEFKEQSNKMLEELALMLPTESICEARCTYYDRYFFFQIKLINSTIEFSSQLVMDPKKEDTANRNWQIKAIKKMAEDLKSQITQYLAESSLTA